MEKLRLHGFATDIHNAKLVMQTEKQLCDWADNAFCLFNIVPALLAMYATIPWSK